MKTKILIITIMAISFVVKAQTNHLDGQTKLVNPNLNGRTLIIEKNDADSWLTFHDPGQHWFSMGIDRSNGGALSLNTGGVLNSSQFVMKANGYVGLGTSNPTYRLQAQGDIYANNGWFRASGNKGLFFQTHGGGFYMIDNSWIRTYGNKNFYHNTGVMRTDGQLQVGPNGNRLVVNTAGNVGVGTTTPSALLEIRQKEDPNSDKGLIISEPNNSQKIYLHLADNASGEYGYFHLGGNTKLRGNGVHSSFDGALGIGTTNPGAWKLAVNGKIRAKEINVETGWADFVFEKDYNLPTLTQVEQHIKEKGHLKDIPSANDVAENGVFLGEMDSKLLQKIEELTLYTIQQEKEIKNLKEESKVLKSLVNRMNDLEKNLNTKK